MAVGDIYRVVVVGELHGQATNNVFFYQVPEGLDDVNITPAAVAEEFRDTFQAAWLAAASSEWSWQRVECVLTTPTPASAVHTNFLGAATGGVIGESLPTAVAAVIRKRTAFGGRTMRGRSYLAGVPVAGEVNSQLTVIQRGLYTTLAGAYDNDLVIGVGAVRPIVAAYIQATKTHLRRAWITSGDVDVVLRTQRRRQVGKGI